MTPACPDQHIEIELKPCKCGCGQFLEPKTVGEFVNDEHRTKYNNEKRRKTPRKHRKTKAA